MFRVPSAVLSCVVCCALVLVASGATAQDASAGLLDNLNLDRASIVTVPAESATESDRVQMDLPVIQGLEAKLDLVPQSVRARGFKLLVSDEKSGGLREQRSAPARTWRGRYKIPGGEEGAVAASMREGRVHARLLPDEDLPDIYVEPLERDEHVAYTPDDVSAPEKSCASALGEEGEEHGKPGPGRPPAPAPETSAATTVYECELVVDVDYDMYLSWDSSTVDVQEGVEALLNQVNVQYERDVGIRFVLSALVIRTSSTEDPYTTTNYDLLLDELEDEMLAGDLSDLDSDLTHLFTGRNLDGSVIGVAYLGVVCGSSTRIGLSQVSFSSTTSSRTDLLAHELGHNFNARHCTCTGYTMNPYLTGANKFNSGSISEIVAHRDSRTCLDEVDGGPPEPPEPPVDPDEPGQAFIDANSDLRYVEADGDVLLPAGVFADGKFDMRQTETGYATLVASGGIVFPPSMGDFITSGVMTITAKGDLTIDVALSSGSHMTLTSLAGDIVVGTRVAVDLVFDSLKDLTLRASLGTVDFPAAQLTGDRIALTARFNMNVAGATLDGITSVKLTVDAGGLDASNVTATTTISASTVAFKCRDDMLADGATLVAKLTQLTATVKGISARGVRLESCASIYGDALVQGKTASDLTDAVLLAGHLARAWVDRLSNIDLSGATIANTGGTSGEVSLRGKIITVEGATILDAGPDDPAVDGTLSGTATEFGPGVLTCE